MSKEKNVWYTEEILLNTKKINTALQSGDLSLVEEILRAETVLSRDPETGRLRPKKVTEYTLRLISEILCLMKMNIEDNSYRLPTLAVAEQCLRLIRSCAASGMKIQTYISKDLTILEDMLAIFRMYQHLNDDIDEDLSIKFESVMVALTQTLGNLVVNNPFNQTIIWDKFGPLIMNSLLGHNEKIASCSAMIVYNILLGQPNVLPDDVMLLNALAYMYAYGNSEFPHLIMEYLIGVENSYIEKLYNRLENETKLLILNLAYNILMSFETQDINVSVNFIKFIVHEFKVKSDCVLKTVDKYVASIDPQEVVYLLDIIAAASSMESYMECLQSDVSLFINISFLLRCLHKLSKEEGNFHSSIQKLYKAAGRTPPDTDQLNELEESPGVAEKSMIDQQYSVKKCDSSDMLQATETVSECTESESSEQYFECTDAPFMEKVDPNNIVENLENQLTFIENKSSVLEPSIPPVIVHDAVCGINFPRQTSMDRKISEAKIDENLIKMAFAKNIKPDLSQAPLAEINLTNNNPLEKVTQQEDPSRKISLEHKIDIGEMEPPLITDSPEAVDLVTVKQSAPSLSRNSSLDSKVERKDSIGAHSASHTPKVLSNPQTPFNMSRQQSVEPGIEASETVIREMTTHSAETGAHILPLAVQKIKANQPIAAAVNETPVVNPNAIEVEIPASITPTSRKVGSEPIAVKKSQNVSHEFDLSEQLQKILGISADKTNLKPEHVESKETHSVHVTHQKVEAPQSLSQSATSAPTVVHATKPSQKPKVQIKVPNVKIETPESNLKNKAGSSASSGPKKLHTMVQTVEQHVAFGFKATLIRTLGNLCWKNQLNKRQIRELEVIPVLLDCCQIDSENPLIMQWVILAVRNFCENCPENQAVIASLTLKEPVDNKFLKEMRLTINTDPEKDTNKK